jgi:hypothetical protein
MRPVAFDLVTEYDLVTFTVIVGMWLTTIWLAYRIGLQSVRDEHDEADRPQIQSFKIHLTSAEGLPAAVIVGQLHQGERGELAVDLGQTDVHGTVTANATDNRSPSVATALTLA